MFHSPLPSQKPTSERTFPPQGRGEKPQKKAASPQHKTKHQREKNAQKTFQKGKGREKSKGFSNSSFIEVAGFWQRNLFYVWEVWPVIWVATATRGTCNKTRLYSGMLCNNGRHHPLLLLKMEKWIDGWMDDGWMDEGHHIWTDWMTKGQWINLLCEESNHKRNHLLNLNQQHKPDQYKEIE